MLKRLSILLLILFLIQTLLPSGFTLSFSQKYTQTNISVAISCCCESNCNCDHDIEFDMTQFSSQQPNSVLRSVSCSDSPLTVAISFLLEQTRIETIRLVVDRYDLYSLSEFNSFQTLPYYLVDDLNKPPQYILFT